MGNEDSLKCKSAASGTHKGRKYLWLLEEKKATDRRTLTNHVLPINCFAAVTCFCHIFVLSDSRIMSNITPRENERPCLCNLKQ